MGEGRLPLQDAQKAVQQGHSKRRGESFSHPPAPSLRDRFFPRVPYGESLSEARTRPGLRHVSACRGWAGETSDFFSILLTSSCLAVPWFPSLGSLVLIEIHAIANASRPSGKEFVVPYLGPVRRLLQALGVSKPVNEFVLCRDADAGFKLLNPGAGTGTQE
jgi:hypothetical protein